MPLEMSWFYTKQLTLTEELKHYQHEDGIWQFVEGFGTSDNDLEWYFEYSARLAYVVTGIHPLVWRYNPSRGWRHTLSYSVAGLSNEDIDLINQYPLVSADTCQKMIDDLNWLMNVGSIQQHYYFFIEEYVTLSNIYALILDNKIKALSPDAFIKCPMEVTLVNNAYHLPFTLGSGEVDPNVAIDANGQYSVHINSRWGKVEDQMLLDFDINSQNQ